MVAKFTFSTQWIKPNNMFLCLLAFDRETNESNLLLKEKADNLQGKLQRAEQRVTELMRVEIENEVCKCVFS